jgi:predicted dehydrogenase
MMGKIKFAVIGAGNIGSFHISYLNDGKVTGCELVAVCDTNPAKLDHIQKQYGDQFKLYSSDEEVFQDPDIDAVIVATPHYDHPVLAIAAMEAGKHVLIEKPAGVYTKKVREMNEVAKQHPELTFGLVYNQRMNPFYQKVRKLVQEGAIGEIRRTNWIITTWYRSQSYYNSGGWRATWKGEGGGVLLNQDPHQIDLCQWICGMPNRVYSFAYFGKHRNIEVEDEVTAFVEYPNGATGVFVTSVSEVAGTNRLEIMGSQGKIVIENNKLQMWKAVIDEAEFNATWEGGFGEPEVWKIDVPMDPFKDDGHMKVTQNFVNHILHGEELLAPGTDGIKGLSISNAMHLSTWLGEWVDLPIDEDKYYEELKKRIDSSKEKETADQVLDTSTTY